MFSASFARGVGHVPCWVSTGKSAMSIDLTDLHNLPVSEKLRIVEALWDDIGSSDEPIVLHPWQRDEAKRRSNEMKADPSLSIDREELWRRVNG
jgi:putative addiction module component (TIGR02574 family)